MSWPIGLRGRSRFHILPDMYCMTLRLVQYKTSTDAQKGEIMLDIEEIRQALQDRVLTAVEKQTGINRNTLAAIRSGTARNPSHRTIAALSEYLAPKHPRAGQTDDQ